PPTKGCPTCLAPKTAPQSPSGQIQTGSSASSKNSSPPTSSSPSAPTTPTSTQPQISSPKTSKNSSRASKNTRRIPSGSASPHFRTCTQDSHRMKKCSTPSKSTHRTTTILQKSRSPGVPMNS